MSRERMPQEYKPFGSEAERQMYLAKNGRELIPATPKQIVGQLRPGEYLFVVGEDFLKEIPTHSPEKLVPVARSVKAYYAVNELQRKRLLATESFQY